MRLSRGNYGSSAGYMDCEHGIGPANTQNFSLLGNEINQPVCRVVDLGKSQPTEQVNALRKGKASPLRTSNASSKTSSPSSLPEQFSRTRSRLLLWFEKIPLLPSRDDSDEH